jgi:hypothetical protein
MFLSSTTFVLQQLKGVAAGPLCQYGIADAVMQLGPRKRMTTKRKPSKFELELGQNLARALTLRFLLAPSLQLHVFAWLRSWQDFLRLLEVSIVEDESDAIIGSSLMVIRCSNTTFQSFFAAVLLST